ncbi:hypothetical protein PN462_04850 [Spirulina sp. CS-785/01]|uniref:hypothetical protein n=1 Tax=Spirulina sp. CS-785/01 TaxID=3021716 RepID=UPI00232E0E3F|nr:hypothetical protein [Spirulina sp. CS-785/01]MDB9312424.1 hypothetical protein [Spirulina sp. CS-785/01]
METLGYTEMAVTYEEVVGPLELRPLSIRQLNLSKLNLKRITTAAAIIGFIFFGGFTAVVASSLSRDVTPSQPEANF